MFSYSVNDIFRMDLKFMSGITSDRHSLRKRICELERRDQGLASSSFNIVANLMEISS